MNEYITQIATTNGIQKRKKTNTNKDYNLLTTSVKKIQNYENKNLIRKLKHKITIEVIVYKNNSNYKIDNLKVFEVYIVDLITKI